MGQLIETFTHLLEPFFLRPAFLTFTRNPQTASLNMTDRFHFHFLSVDSSYEGSCPGPILASIVSSSGVLCSHSSLIVTQPVDLFTDTTFI